MPSEKDTEEARLLMQLQKWADGKATLKDVRGYSDEELYAIAKTAYFFYYQGRLDEARTLFQGLYAVNPADSVLRQGARNGGARRRQREGRGRGLRGRDQAFSSRSGRLRGQGRGLHLARRFARARRLEAGGAARQRRRSLEDQGSSADQHAPAGTAAVQRVVHRITLAHTSARNCSKILGCNSRPLAPIISR